jgi:hypothetical protein
MDQDNAPVVVATPSPYKPYVAGLLALIAVMVGAQVFLLHEDVKKCGAFYGAVNQRFTQLPASSSPQELVRAKERITEILKSDPAGCENVGTAFNGVIEKCMTILLSLITGASLAASSINGVVASPHSPRKKDES